MTICKNLNWDLHIKNLITKASMRLLNLKLHKRLLALENNYISIIRPILEYGHIIYDNCSSSTAQTIEKFQYETAKACTGAYRHTN